MATLFGFDLWFGFWHRFRFDIILHNLLLDLGFIFILECFLLLWLFQEIFVILLSLLIHFFLDRWLRCFSWVDRLVTCDPGFFNRGYDFLSGLLRLFVGIPGIGRRIDVLVLQLLEESGSCFIFS